MTAVVCDASVLVKLLVPEEHSDRARTIADSSKIVAPELIFAEVGNVLWSRIRSGEFDLAAGLFLLEKLASLDLEWRAVRPLTARALAIGNAVDHPIYDCLYLALAESLNVPLVSADGRFIAAVRKSGMATTDVKLLAEFA